MCAHSVCVFWADDLGVCLRRRFTPVRRCGDVMVLSAHRSLIHVVNLFLVTFK